ncbi:MAG: phage/plasmid primase, P4 family [Microcystaceae cyanobacterium]
MPSLLYNKTPNNPKTQAIGKQEWLNSTIDPNLIDLNLKILDGSSAYESLLYSEQLRRRNDGRLNDNTLRANSHLEHGGWWVSAIDPETGEERLWGQFKPHQPKVTPDGKTRKYESPPKEPTEAICLKITRRIGLKVALCSGILKKYRERIREQWIMTEGITYKDFLRLEDPTFWKWVKENLEVAIAVVEGVKKAGALLSQGVAALSIPGIWNGCPKDAHGNPILLPQLQYFTQPGREIVMVFDQDEKVKTQANVIAARERLSSCFREACCKVTFLSWDTEDKGIDDGISTHGQEWFKDIWKSRGTQPAPVKVTKLDHNLPQWSEEGLSIHFETLYKDRLIFEEESKEWYLYGAEIDGKWSSITKEKLEQRLILELRELKEQFKSIADQIFKAISAVKNSNRDKKEKEGIIRDLKNQIPRYRDITISFIEKLGKHLSRLLLTKAMTTNSQSRLIPFKNGVLDLESQQWFNHDPKYLFTWQLPYDYNPLAQCDPIKQWLLETMNGDQSLVELIRAYFYGILTGRTDWQKYLELIGTGGAGKGTIMRLAIALIGFNNCHTTTLKELETNKFETANLKHKRLTVISEADDYIGSLNILKALTGQDPLRNEVKNKQATTFTPECLVMILSNENIRTKDYTNGLARRRITIGFNKSVDPHLRRDLISFRGNGEMSGEFVHFIPGLLNWVLGINPDYATALIKDCDQQCSGLARQKIETLISTNSLAAWLNENVVYDPESFTYVGNALKSKDETEVYLESGLKLYPNYCRHAVGSGLGQISKNHFRSRLVDLCQHQLKLKGVEDDKNHRHGKFIRGLRLRTDSDTSPPLLEQVFLSSNKGELEIEEINLQLPLCHLQSDDLRQPQTTSDNLADNQNPVIDNLDNLDNLKEDFEFNQLNTSNLPLEDDVMSPSANECISKSSERSSRSSQPSISGFRSSEEVVPGRLKSSEEVSDSQQHKIIDRRELSKRIDDEVERIGWSVSIGKEYLLNTYKVSERKYLTDDQLLEFYEDLKAANRPTKQQTPAYEVGQFLQGLILHPLDGMIPLKGKVIEVNGRRELKDQNGYTYPLAVIEDIKPLSWEDYHC